MADFTYMWELETKVRHVRTQAGAQKYGEPIGAPIVPARKIHATETTRKKSTTSLKPGDEVITASVGVGRAVKPSSDGDVRRVASVEDAEKQHGPSGKGKHVVRFQDGTFTGPVDVTADWRGVEKAKPKVSPTQPTDAGLTSGGDVGQAKPVKPPTKATTFSYTTPGGQTFTRASKVKNFDHAVLMEWEEPVYAKYPSTDVIGSKKREHVVFASDAAKAEREANTIRKVNESKKNLKVSIVKTTSDAPNA